MKALFAALILTTLTGPVLALNLPSATGPGVSAIDVLPPLGDEFGRRSGRCPHRPEPIVLPGQIVAREGSACGGV